MLSAPKSGSVASLTLDPLLVQDLTLTLASAALFGGLFEVREGGEGRREGWRLQSPRSSARAERAPLSLPTTLHHEPLPTDHPTPPTPNPRLGHQAARH